MIPKIIHYVWVGPKRISDEALRLIDGWRKILPDYEIMRWDNDNIDFSNQFVQSAFAVGAWNRVSNYQRMTALMQHGGIYLDTDVEVRKSFDPLLDNTCFLGFQHRTSPIDMVNGAVLAAEKGHWFPQTLRDYLMNKLQGAVDVGSFSGPGLISHTLKENGLKAYSDEPIKIKDITVYPLRYFYPYNWEETFTEACVTPDTYAIHLWEHTWKKTSLPRWQIWKKIKKKVDYKLALVAPEFAYKRTLRHVRRAQKSGC